MVTEGRRLTRPRITKRLALVIIDDLAWAVGLSLAALERFNVQVDRVHWSGLVILLPFAWVAQLYAGRVAGLYRGRWMLGSFEEVAAVARAALVATALLVVIDIIPM